jgi:hypothetical protein
MSQFMPTLCVIGGGLLALWGALFTIGLVPRLDVSSGRSAVDLLGLLVFGLGPLTLGLVGMWYGKRRLTQVRQAARVEQEASLERAILDRVRAHPQGITSQEVALNTPFSPQEVEAKLGRLFVNGVLDMEVTEQGQLVYKPKAG